MPGDATVAQRIADLFEPWNRADTPGVSVSVRRQGETVARCQRGMADLAHGVPIGPGTRFHYCSITKMFVAAGLCLLEADGALSINDPAGTLLPELPGGDRIRYRDLLSMTAGLQDIEEVLCLANILTRLPGIDRLWLDRALNNPERAFPAGTGVSYTNTHYLLLSLVIERASGLGLEPFWKSRVFAPLGITGVELRSDPRIVSPDLARGYVPMDDGGFRDGLAFGFLGGGGLIGGLRALEIFGDAFRRDDLCGVAIRSRMAAFGRLADGRQTNYGLGLFRHPYRGATVIGHSGGMPGYKTWLAHVPEHGVDIAFLSNRDDAESAAKLRAILDVALDRALTRPVAGFRQVPPSYDPEALAGEWVCRETGETLTVTPRDDHIETDRQGFPSLFRPIAPTRLEDPWFCYTSVLDIVMTGDGAIDHIALTAEAGPRIFRRVAPFTQDLVDFVGVYRNRRHEITHRISLADDRLLLALCDNPHLGEVFPLRPLAPGCFAMTRSLRGSILRRGLRFDRDAAGRVARLRYFGPRLHGLELTRKEPDDGTAGD